MTTCNQICTKDWSACTGAAAQRRLCFMHFRKTGPVQSCTGVGGWWAAPGGRWRRVTSPPQHPLRHTRPCPLAGTHHVSGACLSLAAACRHGSILCACQKYRTSLLLKRRMDDYAVPCIPVTSFTTAAMSSLSVPMTTSALLAAAPISAPGARIRWAHSSITQHTRTRRDLMQHAHSASAASL